MLGKTRGKIRNRERAKQLKDFSGLRFRNITPTDIDGFFEFCDILFVFFEAKRSGVDLPYGQKLGLTRICDAIDQTINESGRARTAVLVVIEHNEECEQDIDFAIANVVNVYRDQKWEAPKCKTSCSEFVERLLLQVGLGWKYLSAQRLHRMRS